MGMSPERLARDRELCAIEALFRFQRNGVARRGSFLRSSPTALPA
jgi:hypothetical protein